MVKSCTDLKNSFNITLFLTLALSQEHERRASIVSFSLSEHGKTHHQNSEQESSSPPVLKSNALFRHKKRAIKSSHFSVQRSLTQVVLQQWQLLTGAILWKDKNDFHRSGMLI